jgi:hypothetical protein
MLQFDDALLAEISPAWADFLPDRMLQVRRFSFERRPVPKQYLGHLSSHDPLHPYLVQDVLPQIGVRNRAADFRVFSMKDGKVYLYQERHSCTQVVGKFFVSGGHHSADGMKRMRQEFDNLQLLRGYGLAGYPHHIVRPLGTNAWLNSILVEEYAPGVPLSAFVNDAIHQGQSQPLFDKLTALAYFLATLHNRTANGLAWISTRTAPIWTGWSGNCRPRR